MVHFWGTIGPHLAHFSPLLASFAKAFSLLGQDFHSFYMKLVVPVYWDKFGPQDVFLLLAFEASKVVSY